MLNLFLCPTRWTVRADAMTSVISNYSVLHALWNSSLDNCKVAEMKWSTSTHAAIRVHIWLGVGPPQSAPAYRQLEYVCQQRRSLSAAECLPLAAITIRTLKNMRADSKFALFCKDVTTLAEHNIVNAPVLPGRRRLPARYEDRNASSGFYETPGSRYRHVWAYFEALDKWAMSR